SLCVLRSCRHDSPIHAPAEYITTTGSQVGDRPSLGAWITYGLGSKAKDLPAFVVFLAGSENGRPVSRSSGFLPASYQGTRVGAEGIQDLPLPSGTTKAQRRAQLDLMAALNREHQKRLAGESELEARIRSYELAYRMQTAAPEAFDLTRETKETKKL